MHSYQLRRLLWPQISPHKQVMKTVMLHEAPNQESWCKLYKWKKEWPSPHLVCPPCSSQVKSRWGTADGKGVEIRNIRCRRMTANSHSSRSTITTEHNVKRETREPNHSLLHLVTGVSRAQRQNRTGTQDWGQSKTVLPSWTPRFSTCMIFSSRRVSMSMCSVLLKALQAGLLPRRQLFEDLKTSPKICGIPGMKESQQNTTCYSANAWVQATTKSACFESKPSNVWTVRFLKDSMLSTCHNQRRKDGPANHSDSWCLDLKIQSSAGLGRGSFPERFHLQQLQLHFTFVHDTHHIWLVSVLSAVRSAI